MTPISHSQDASPAEVLEVDFNLVGKLSPIHKNAENVKYTVDHMIREYLDLPEGLDIGQSIMARAAAYLPEDLTELRMLDYGTGVGYIMQLMARAAQTMLSEAAGYDPLREVHQKRKAIKTQKTLDGVTYRRRANLPDDVRRKISWHQSLAALNRQPAHFNFGICSNVSGFWTTDEQFLAEAGSFAHLLELGATVIFTTPIYIEKNTKKDRVKRLGESAVARNLSMTLSLLELVGLTLEGQSSNPQQASSDMQEHEFIMRKTRNVQFRQRGA